MYKLLIGSAAAALVALAPAIAASIQPNHGNHPGGGRAMMNKTETRAEAQDHVKMMFAKVDANKDGFISSAEMDAMKAKRGEKKQAKMEQRAANFDPAKAFARLDSNKDGKLTKAEVGAVKAAHKASNSNGHGADRLFARVDTNKDGVVTLAEMQAMPKPKFDGNRAGKPGHGGGMGRMMGQADLNKDGKVTLAEAQQAALTQFDRADTNKDGTVTPEERKAAMQAMRAQHKG
ncbi:MAG: EF-hand domain-containing protein [Sphingomonas sp.]|nr:EF-hand domain-containing protein [Sphingomonas sp.]